MVYLIPLYTVWDTPEVYFDQNLIFLTLPRSSWTDVKNNIQILTTISGMVKNVGPRWSQKPYYASK